MMVAVVKAVAEAPPPTFSGGGKWEAMHGDMTGWYEVRVDGPKRHHYRLFCLLERDGARVGRGGPSLVPITGKDKPFRTELSDADYAAVRRLGDEYRARAPRSVARGPRAARGERGKGTTTRVRPRAATTRTIPRCSTRYAAGPLFTSIVSIDNDSSSGRDMRSPDCT
jgi:hypothetical protein